MRFPVLVLAVLVLAGCGADGEGGALTAPAASPPYSDLRTGRCLQGAGYEVSYCHGDPPSEKPEEIVFYVWLDDLGSTAVHFYDPSVMPPPDGEVFGNAVVALDHEAATEDDRRRILDCLG